MRRLRLRVVRGHRSSKGRALVTRVGRTPELRDRVRRWLLVRVGRCIRRGRSRLVRVEVRVDLALLRGRDSVVARDDLGLGIGQELLRAG